VQSIQDCTELRIAVPQRHALSPGGWSPRAIYFGQPGFPCGKWAEFHRTMGFARTLTCVTRSLATLHTNCDLHTRTADKRDVVLRSQSVHRDCLVNYNSSTFTFPLNGRLDVLKCMLDMPCMLTQLLLAGWVGLPVRIARSPLLPGPNLILGERWCP
jgi:hypothetical protein